MAIDLDKLLKILGMTGSTHDAEALTALRKAQALMKEAKVSWADLLKPKNDAAYAPPQYSDIFRDQYRDAAFNANRNAYEQEQKARAKQQAEQNAKEYDEIMRRYKEAQQRANQRTPGFGDDLYEAIFGRKRNK